VDASAFKKPTYPVYFYENHLHFHSQEKEDEDEDDDLLDDEVLGKDGVVFLVVGRVVEPI